VSSPATVTIAQWSADGYRIAYIAGQTLNIVAGDGTDNHPLAMSVAPITPAWQPDTGQIHRVAFVDRVGDIELRNADTGALLWRIRPLAPPRQLLWSRDGTRLLTTATHRLSVYDSRGRLLASGAVAPGDTVGPAAFAAGYRFAVILHQVHQPTDTVAVLDAGQPGLDRAPQTLFTAPERITGIAWSPDHRWLIASSRSADQWIFVRVVAPTRLTAVSDIADQFRPERGRAPGFPVLAGWQP
jgi:hypothetical protein